MLLSLPFAYRNATIKPLVNITKPVFSANSVKVMIKQYMDYDKFSDNKSLRDYYEQVCREKKITPNSVIQKMLPNIPGEKLKGTELDLNRNYIGDRGVLAVCAIIAACPNLKSIKLRDNGIRNKGTIALCEVLKSHRGVTYLDLSNNYISTGAGKALEELLEVNKRIVSVNIDGTKIDPEQRLKILDMLKKRDRE